MKRYYLIKSHSIVRLLLVVSIAAVPCARLFSQQNFVANTSGYDTTRIYHAMDKARNGEDITVAVIGGSITEGYAASTISKRWANLVENWWADKFPSANVSLINAGWGGTGSDIGTFRVQKDVLQYNPDFVVIEFSVNDTEEEKAEKMMEGLCRQVLADTSRPGVMMLLLKQENGATAQASHKPVGNYYDIPMIAYADLIDAQLASDGKSLSDIYVDGVHPNDLGMQYMADFIDGELDTIYNHLPAPGNLPAINTTLPAPLVTDTYQYTYMYDNTSLMYLANSGWKTSSTYWYAENAGDEMSFYVEGNSVSVMYTRLKSNERGQVEAWVDGGPKVVLDAYWEETWGMGTVLNVIEEGLADGVHTLHIRAIDSTSPGATGHYFELINVLKAGNIGDVAPVAIISQPLNYVIGDTVRLDGSSSHDPEGDSLVSYIWSIESKPGTSTAALLNNDTIVSGFVADVEGEYTIGLMVNNGTRNSILATKTITVRGENNIPVAVAGNDTTVGIFKEIKLDGSKSYDADEDPITYHWEIVSAPEGYIPTFKNPDTYDPIIKTKEEGEYVLSLVVNDGFDDSEPDNLTITAIAGYTGLDKYNRTGNNVQVYPNPAGESLYVDYTLKNADAVNISIYNILGVKLYTALNENKLPGKYTIEIPLKKQNLKPGSYLLKIKTGNQEKTVSFIVQ